MKILVLALFVLLALVVMGLISRYQLRRGGPGPRPGYVPKRFRPAVRRLYERRGWTDHFWDQGDL